MPRVSEETIMGQIRALDPGQSFSRSARLDLGGCAPDVGKALAKLRNLLNQAVARVRKEDVGSYFRVESTSGLTSDNKAVIATVCVTKMADDTDDKEIDI